MTFVTSRPHKVFLGTDGGDLFQKCFTLAHARNVHRRYHRKEICLPGVTWERERVDRIAEQAGEWLATFDGKPTAVL